MNICFPNKIDQSPLAHSVTPSIFDDWNKLKLSLLVETIKNNLFSLSCSVAIMKHFYVALLERAKVAKISLYKFYPPAEPLSKPTHLMYQSNCQEAPSSPVQDYIEWTRTQQSTAPHLHQLLSLTHIVKLQLPEELSSSINHQPCSQKPIHSQTSWAYSLCYYKLTELISPGNHYTFIAQTKFTLNKFLI